jgi:hypothetical protein
VENEVVSMLRCQMWLPNDYWVMYIQDIEVWYMQLLTFCFFLIQRSCFVVVFQKQKNFYCILLHLNASVEFLDFYLSVCF